MKLTDTAVRQAKPEAKIRKLFDGNGLILLIHPNGSKYWSYKYRYLDKEKSISLGVYPEVSLAEARQKLSNMRKFVSSGQDPSEVRKATKRCALMSAENSFEAIAREWHETNLHTWSPKHGENVIKRLEGDTFPKLGNRPINGISTPELLSVLRLIEARDALDLTRTIAQYCTRIFAYAIATGRAERNPAMDLRGALKTPVTKHHAHLKAAELPEFMQKLEVYDGELQTKLALKLLMLTFVRTSELRGAEWSEINFDKAEWRIPAERMKMKDPHIVLLSKQALNLFRELQQYNGKWRFVFPQTYKPSKCMSENAMLYALYRMGYRSRTTGHGFRATASTVLNENGFPPDVIERQLAHIERNKVRAAYNHAQYLPERRKMMQWWADYVEGIASSHSNVITGKFGTA
jgi:integrase